MINNYSWEIEDHLGNIYTSGYKFRGDIIRISFIPKEKLLARHDIFFKELKFIKRFTRVFIKQSIGVKEYVHCLVTDRFRLYIFASNGSTLITNVDYELYL